MTDFDRLNAQAKLEDALVNDNIVLFRGAVEYGADPTRLNAENRSVFDTALSTHGKAKFVLECLKNGCDPNFINKYFQKAAIHYAADSGDAAILRVLLDRQGVEVNRKYADLTPLNSLAKNLKPNNAYDVSTCIQILLNYGACPNSCDSSEMTPLLYILQNKDINDGIKKELISMFLKRNDLDLDTYRKGEARKLLMKHHPEFKLPELKHFGSLFKNLQGDKDDRFLRLYRDHYSKMSEDQKVALLLAAIKGRHHKAFDELLLKGVNVNISLDGYTAVEMAAYWGNHVALKKLLKMENLQIWEKDRSLPLVCRILRYTTDNDLRDYQKCFELLLNSKRIDINETDLDGRSALHYAVGDQNKKAILLLLEKGAYWGIRSTFGDLPLEALSADVLEEHFDSCITTNGRKSSDKDLEIIMDYKNFIPPSGEASKIPPKYLNGEMAAIAFIAESKDHRQLLSHPLITSFLFLKWSNYSMIFYLNFFIYLMFALSLMAHIFLKFRASEYEAATRFFGFLSWIGLIYLILREGFQLCMSWRNYIKSFINWIEVALIVSTALTCTELISGEDLQKFRAVATLFLVSIEFCLLIGNLPILSFSTHLLMLKEVLKTFLKSFAFYSIFVITFSLSFYISFGKTAQNKENSTDVLNGANSPIAAAGEQTNNEGDANDQDEFNKFQNPLVAAIKTTVMFTGEFDAGDLQFKTHYNYLVFLIFVIFMSIVLLNLLNGLAVSDTQAIKAQAELSGYICSANLLTRFDNVLAGKTSFLVRLNQICPLRHGFVRCTPSRISVFPNGNHRVMVPMNSTNKKTERNPNNNVVLELEPAAINGGYRTVASDIDDLESQKKLLHTPCFRPCLDGKCSVMDGQTVKMALQVIQRKVVASREAQLEQQQQRLLVEIKQELLNIQENFCCYNKKGLLQQQKVERVSRTVEAITDIPASGYSGELETVSEEKRVRDCPLNGL